MLLSSSDAYCLTPILAKAKALPGARRRQLALHSKILDTTSGGISNRHE